MHASISPGAHQAVNAFPEALHGADRLRRARQWFAEGEYGLAMAGLIRGLWDQRQSMDPDAWREQVRRMQDDALMGIARKCPFTSHGFERPSGYPGDARLIDYLYGYQAAPEGGLARAVHALSTNTPSTRAVRYRRFMLAQMLDRALEERGEEASVLAVACGHLRELDVSHAIKHVRPARFVAIDQDAESLAEVERCFSHLGVSTQQQDIAALLAGPLPFAGLDLAYASGLYDYLNERLATRLTERLFRMLRPDGRLLLANFAPDAEEAGYLEAVMDWWLVYRDEAAMLRLTRSIPQEGIGRLVQYRDPESRITFLELQRACLPAA